MARGEGNGAFFGGIMEKHQKACRRDSRPGRWNREVEDLQVGTNRIRLDPLSNGDGSFSIIKGIIQGIGILYDKHRLVMGVRE